VDSALDSALVSVVVSSLSPTVVSPVSPVSLADSVLNPESDSSLPPPPHAAMGKRVKMLVK